ncbi:hypothetical protein DSW25_07530 [Sulfitobacter donghicola DSW-25 = KCTC 12864 = JCM 14565]|uniref:Uncharacterized protein n=1 Tax=Sulfitobacter donghicola DSW-25 = KCTC 12864 = JCM 14565 TaxID=1300350 RepID=A0A073IY54_9RHOB|nr:hypothetical protein DSW25_07530 [Sulfitobacter donghicola DSW-25 = KCTC 12864 = JCM 14565]
MGAMVAGTSIFKYSNTYFSQIDALVMFDCGVRVLSVKAVNKRKIKQKIARAAHGC